MSDNRRTSARWPRPAIFAVGALVLLNAAREWYTWAERQGSQTIARPIQLGDLVIPLILSGLGIGIVFVGTRSRASGVRSLVLTILLGVAVVGGINIYAYWQEHHGDFGDQDDLTKPWRNGGIDFSPGPDATPSRETVTPNP